MELKNVFVAILATAIVSAAVTRYCFPQIKTQTIEATKEVSHADIKTITRYIERPDGSKESVTETVDHSIKQETSTKTATTFAAKNWQVSASASSNFTKLEPIYGLQVQRRVLGPFFVGLQADTSHTAGVSLGMEF